MIMFAVTGAFSRLWAMDVASTILITDPNLDQAIIEIDAKGSGKKIQIRKGNPIKDVTDT